MEGMTNVQTLNVNHQTFFFFNLTLKNNNINDNFWHGFKGLNSKDESVQRSDRNRLFTLYKQF